MNPQKIIHLYNRVGFGLLPNELKKISHLSVDEHVDLLLKKAKKQQPLKVNTSELSKYDHVKNEREKRMMLQKVHRKLLVKLNTLWFKNLYSSESLLQDKMCLFWTNHFVCSSNFVDQTEQYLKVIQKHALGDFRDFVVAISKNPMMIRYLNNQQNRKKKPNENYARELMELFTLGVGHYTEQDIKESARAFTGWGTNAKNEFVFRDKQHDYGTKTFLGKTGKFDGTDIINIILEQPECALFICEKVYKEFVNPNPNSKHIKKMAKVFRKKYRIDDLMKYTLTSDWFYDTENMHVKIKSPVELLVGIHKVIPFEFKKERYFQYLQFNLGQKLLYPPNVAGWPGDKQWIDANTIMIRLKLTSAIAQQRAIEIAAESDFEDDFDMISKRKKNKAYFIFTNLNWTPFQNAQEGTNLEDWKQVLLGNKLSKETEQVIQTINHHTPREFCIALMSLPEYQMC
ncbi:DUF1800 domain-containing protein [Ochrovirga pacifica]|uniref:DUF1800 domain-containing protein n=1 Tax=Ochrovirga pacifica TaxID=1042376 RepID=UPI0002557B93|nr:DUF1800 domain-containing protein [Ochrovirga pacifica]